MLRVVFVFEIEADFCWIECDKASLRGISYDMGRVFAAVFVIFGAVVGSGFSSGKEIFVYFSRFGAISFVSIFVACILFFFLFKFILSNGEILSTKIKKTKWITLVTGFVSTIFCASMLSGLSNLFSYFGWLQVVLMALVALLCWLVAQRGLASLEKINTSVMPIVAVMFFVVLLSFLAGAGGFCKSNYVGVLYAPLYVALNTAMNTLVLSELGKGMSKKQIFWTCVLSVGLIFVFLMLGNSALGSASSELEMPFLTIAEGNSVVFWVMFFIIMSGCFTTLVSLCYTLNCAFLTFIKNGKVSALLSVGVPLAISMLGFSRIVTILYPICSMAGVFVLVFLIVKR